MTRGVGWETWKPMTLALRQLSLSIVLATAALACSDQGGGASSAAAKPAADKSGAPAAKSAAPAAAGGQIASCNVIKAESMCREYSKDTVEAAGADSLKTTCTGLQGEFKMDGCPKDKRVGSCVTPEGTKIFYTGGGYPIDAAKGEKNCKEGVPAGEWKAGQ